VILEAAFQKKENFKKGAHITHKKRSVYLYLLSRGLTHPPVKLFDFTNVEEDPYASLDYYPWRRQEASAFVGLVFDKAALVLNALFGNLWKLHEDNSRVGIL
jgi:hypothetical protein